MRCLLGIVLASACGSTVPLTGPGVEYPKGLYVSKPDRCTPSRVEPAIYQHLACDFSRR